jgi:hypothetical protein
MRFAISYRCLRRHTVCSPIFLEKQRQKHVTTAFRKLELWCIV